MMQLVCELKVLGAVQVKYLLKIKGTPLGYLREVFLVTHLPPHPHHTTQSIDKIIALVI
jgi:hypothetical protein